METVFDEEDTMSAFGGRVVVVTGGAGGIGRAAAELLARSGARVVITDVNEEAGRESVRELDELAPGQVRFEPLDVSDPHAVEALADRLEADGWQSWGAFANAGIAPTAPAASYSDELWRRTLDVNLSGVFWTARAFGRRAIEHGRGGAIVLTSSIAGFGVVSPETHAAYGASKAGVAHLAELLGVEWARTGVRVNAVAPGYTTTPILDRIKNQTPDVYRQRLARIPVGRLNTPDQIARAVVFLLSEDASGITATTLRVDNGYSAR